MPDDGRNRLLDLGGFEVNVQPLTAPLSPSREFERPSYVLENRKWGSSSMGTPGGTIRWMIVGADQLYPSAEYTDAAIPIDPVFNATIRAAFDRWEEVGNFDFVEVDNWGTANIFVIFDELSGEGSSTIGLANTYFRGSVIDSSYISFDIGRRYRLLNNSVQLVGTPQNSNTISLYTLALHEIGHALGLDHEDDFDTIMSSFVPPGISDLTSDEIAAIQAIYGAKGSIPTDDYAATTATSGTIAVGGSVTGTIETGGDSDWFRVTLTGGSTYRVNLDGGTLSDPFVYLRNANGISIASDDDSGTGLNAQLSYTITTTGVYYIDAKSATTTGTGTYTLQLTQTASADDYSQTTATTGTIAVDGSVSAFINTASDRDWFRLTLTQGQIYTIRMTPSAGSAITDPAIYLLNASGSLVPSSEGAGSGGSTISVVASRTGTYYVDAISRVGTGAYTVSVISDDYAASSATAGTVTVGGTRTGNIETTADHDWLRVSLTSGQSYTVAMSGAGAGGGTLTAPLVYLKNSSGVTIASGSTPAGGVSSLTYVASVTGTYYIEALANGEAGAGTYTVAVTQPPADDYAGSSSTTGVVTTTSNGTSTSGSIEASGDSDWFRVTLTAGTAYRFRLTGGTLTNAALSLRNSSGLVLATDDDGGNAQITYTPTTGGTYFLDARAAASGTTGTYTVAADNLSLDDFGVTAGTAGSVVVGSSATGVIGATGDLDWFRVDLTAGVTYRFDLRGAASSGGTLANPFLSLLNASGVFITTDDDTGVGADSQLIYTATATGAHYLVASSAVSTATGTYTVAASLATDDYPATTATTGTVAAGGTATGYIHEAGDVDWFRVTLTAGTQYQLDARGSATSGGTLADPAVAVVDSSGMVLRADNDSGVGADGRLIFTPGTSGTYYVAARSGATDGTGSYTVALTANPDDYVGSAVTTGTVAIGGYAVGNIETANDRDWFKVTLTAGTTYRVSVRGADARYGTLSNPQLSIYSTLGAALVSDDDTGFGLDAAASFTPTTTGTYYIEARGALETSGTYTVFVAGQATDDYAASTATTGVATVGGTVRGKTEVLGDRDWFRVTLTAGATYRIRLETEQYGSLPSTFASARLRDSSGTALTGDEQTGAAAVAELTYTPTATGTFYIDAEAYNLGSANYRISVATATSSLTVEAAGAALTDAELAAITAPPAISLEDLQIAVAPLAAQRERSPLDILFDSPLALAPEDRDLAMTADPFQRLAAFQPGSLLVLLPVN